MCDIDLCIVEPELFWPLRENRSQRRPFSTTLTNEHVVDARPPSHGPLEGEVPPLEDLLALDVLHVLALDGGAAELVHGDADEAEEADVHVADPDLEVLR